MNNQTNDKIPEDAICHEHMIIGCTLNHKHTNSSDELELIMADHDLGETNIDQTITKLEAHTKSAILAVLSEVEENLNTHFFKSVTVRPRQKLNEAWYEKVQSELAKIKSQYEEGK